MALPAVPAIIGERKFARRYWRSPRYFRRRRKSWGSRTAGIRALARDRTGTATTASRPFVECGAMALLQAHIVMIIFSRASSSDLRHARPILQIGRRAPRVSLSSVQSGNVMRYCRLARCFLRLLILGALFGMGAAQAAPFAYISNSNSNNVSVINTATN